MSVLLCTVWKLLVFSIVWVLTFYIYLYCFFIFWLAFLYFGYSFFLFFLVGIIKRTDEQQTSFHCLFFFFFSVILFYFFSWLFFCWNNKMWDRLMSEWQIQTFRTHLKSVLFWAVKNSFNFFFEYFSTTLFTSKRKIVIWERSLNWIELNRKQKKM